MPEERSLYLFASVLSAAIFGVEVCPVQVEADVSNGLPSFIMVGFPSAQVKEAQERVRTALKNNGYQFPPKRITVNFAPADMKKEGAGFDVPVAAAVLAAFEMISPQVVSRVMMAGEIGLDGEIHGISGILPIVLCARSLGSRFCVVPYENLEETAMAVANRIAQIPPESAKIIKYSLNKCYELQGFRSTIDFVSEMFNLGRIHMQTTGVDEFRSDIAEGGLTTALKKQYGK